MDTMVHGVAVASNGYRRSAADVAREFLSASDDVYEAGQLHEMLTDVLMAYAAASNREVIVPWAFGGTDCLHHHGAESVCQIYGCPRRPPSPDTHGTREA